VDRDVRTGDLYPGQIETSRFPVVGERSSVVPDDWELVVSGLVDTPATFDLISFLALAQHSMRADIHCVTSWSQFDVEWTGVPLSALLEVAGVQASARFVRFAAYSTRNHDTSLPLDLALEDCWLVHSLNGVPLSDTHGGPVRTVVPSRYFYKSLKWVRRIELVAEDQLGFWERTSDYHNGADPVSGYERFTTGSLRPAQLERFLAAENYAKYRKKVLLGLDLRSWDPKSKALRGLVLKNCDLRGVDLSKSDLRESNLSLSDLRGADLSSADVRGSDLEGADFTGADLSNADLSFSALSATRFSDGTSEAVVAGMKWEDVFGLVESQEEFLEHHASGA
jgi:DMSO/TMAO reductase YedYZ molybdopterin-dependent catalytic subunit